MLKNSKKDKKNKQSEESSEFIQDPVLQTTHKVRLGDQVRDVVTGAEGLVVSYTKHLTGCDTVLIELGVTTEGKMPIISLDITRLEIVEAGKLPKEMLPGFAKPSIIPDNIEETWTNQPIAAAG